jgi:hypothetical protein
MVAGDSTFEQAVIASRKANKNILKQGFMGTPSSGE